MKYIRNILYTIALILFLEVIKKIIGKMHLPYGYFLGTMVAGIQFLVCLAIVFSLIILAFFQKQVKSRKGIWLAGSLFILLIVGMECLAVYWLHHPRTIPRFLDQPYRYYYTRYDRNIIQFDTTLASYDTALFYKFRPGISGRFANAEFNTRIDANSLGIRDAEASLHKPDIICLGDSYAMGWGVEQHETFSEQLEQLSGMKILNGGMSSYGTARELIRFGMLDTTALKYLVVQYCVNDFGENDQFLQHARKLPISSAAAYDSLVNAQQWNATYFPGKVFLTTGQVFLKMQVNKLYPLFSMNDSQNDNPESRLQAMKFLEVLNEPAIDFQKVKIIVVFVDDYKFRNSTFPEELQALARQMPYKQKFAAGFQVINMYKHLSEQDFYQLDTHLRPSGHKKIATSLWQSIKQQ